MTHNIKVNNDGRNSFDDESHISAPFDIDDASPNKNQDLNTSMRSNISKVSKASKGKKKKKKKVRNESAATGVGMPEIVDVEQFDPYKEM